MIFERDSWQEIFAAIKKNKLRTSLTMLGVMWGIFMLVVMLGAGNGLRNGITGEFAGTATNSFFIWGQQTTKPYEGMKPGRNISFDNADIKSLEAIKELKYVSPQNQLGGYQGSNNVVRGLKSGGFAVKGCYPNIVNIAKVGIDLGRMLNENDLAENRKVCVIGSRVKEVLFKPEEKPIGNYIRINGVYFMVIGVTKNTSGGGQGREQSQEVMIPFSTFQKAFNNGDHVGWFSVSANDDVPADVAEEKVIAQLKERHKIAPTDLRAIGHWNMSTEFKKMSGLFDGIEMLVWFVGVGTLLAGIIGISNIMLIVVKERTREIGVKRALGATPFNIIAQIMLEAVFLTALAGYFGLLAGIGLLEALNTAIGDSGEMFRNPTVDLKVATNALIILIVSGALAGLIPARKAVSIHPVEALRAE